MDITAAEPKMMTESVRLVLADPEVHLGIVWLQLMHGYANLLVDVFKEIKAHATKPFLVCWLEAPEQALTALRDGGICVIDGTERVVDAAAGLVAFGEARQRITAVPAPPKTAPVPDDFGPVPSVEAWHRLKASGFRWSIVRSIQRPQLPRPKALISRRREDRITGHPS